MSSIRRYCVGLLLSAAACMLCVGQAFAASPANTFARDCAVCHVPGITGAPKLGDKPEWTRRIRAGIGMLYRNAIEGVPYTAMVAKGGHKDISDDEIKAIVDFMVAAAAIDSTVLDAAARYEKLGIVDRDFIRLDGNFDGLLSRQELAGDAVLVAGLGRFDENRDGNLSPAEYRKAEETLERERAAADVDDTTLVRAVRSALAKVQGIDPQAIKVEADRGAVAMMGLVPNAEAVRHAYGLVRRISGIKKIDNRLVSGEHIGWD
jgi:cytochrome c5